MADLEHAARLRYGDIPAAEKAVRELQQQLAQLQKDGSYLKEEVTEEDIARVVSRWTGIPVSKMLESEKSKLLDMENRLRTRVVGQEEALKAVANAVRRSRAGLSRSATGRSARSCSSARPASARPSSRARSPSSCSTTRAR